MSRQRRHTTALVERIARVREAQAKQRLSRALAHERAQRSLTEASAARLQATDQGLMALLAREKVDLLRTGLYHDLANAQQVALAKDREALEKREQLRTVCADELARKSHYRDRASCRAREAARAYELTEERKEATGPIEVWVLRGVRKMSHE